MSDIELDLAVQQMRESGWTVEFRQPMTNAVDSAPHNAPTSSVSSEWTCLARLSGVEESLIAGHGPTMYASVQDMLSQRG